jgi:hypothetical protein
MKLYELKQIIKEEINRVINESLQDKTHQMIQGDPKGYDELVKIKNAIKVDLDRRDFYDYKDYAEKYENEVKGGKYLRTYVGGKHYLIDMNGGKFRVRELMDMGDEDKDFKFKDIYKVKEGGSTGEVQDLVRALALSFKLSDTRS